MTRTIPETLDVEVFRAGDYGPKGCYDEDTLDALASDYDPTRHEAPVTLDHLQSGPAEGWVAALRRTGDRLVATLGRLSPRLRELLATGSYRKRSVELFRTHRETGRPYLKAVSFLGAATPEVTGLADPIFGQQSAEESLQFTESSPACAASTARERLIQARRWQPAWDDSELPSVFEALGPGEALDRLVCFLLEGPEPVSFGAQARDEAGLADASFGFVGTPSAESQQLHRKALSFLAGNPTLSYSQALLEVSRV